MFSGLDMDATVANAEAGRVWLAARQGANGKVGAIGFCWGGGLVNRFATKSEGLNAAGGEERPCRARKIRLAASFETLIVMAQKV